MKRFEHSKPQFTSFSLPIVTRETCQDFKTSDICIDSSLLLCIFYGVYNVIDVFSIQILH